MRKAVAGLLAVFCLLLAACSDKTSVPFGILSIDKMTPVLWDMVEADQYAAILIKDSAHVDPKMERLRLYEQVFRSHGISREKFEKSFNYYREHPAINQILYDSLTSQGNSYRNEAYAHPSARPAVTPPVVAPGSPAPETRLPGALLPGRTTQTQRGGPQNANPLFHPGRPGIPIIRPVIRPDTSHHKPRPHPVPPPQKPPAGNPSSKPTANKPAP